VAGDDDDDDDDDERLMTELFSASATTHGPLRRYRHLQPDIRLRCKSTDLT